LPFYHFTLSAQYAALIFPLDIFFACLALKDLRRAALAAVSPAFLGEPETPCCPKRMVLTWLPTLATTTCDLVGWLGVRLGLLKPATPARFNRESFTSFSLPLHYLLDLDKDDLLL
jgi:hypothetical protein